MNDTILMLLASLAVGAALGVIFFGGLWWTVRKGLRSDLPSAWFAGSMVLRCGLAVGGFIWIADGQADRLVFCLGGFMLARLAMTRWTRLWAGGADRARKGAGDVT